MIPRFSREIKFRYWDGQDKVLEPVGAIGFGENGEPFLYLDTDEWALGPDLILLQYTGLKDENGVEIYEGDIVMYLDGEFSFTGYVTCDCYCFYICGDDNYHFEDVADTSTGTADLEVIGNVFENPELIGGFLNVSKT